MFQFIKNLMKHFKFIILFFPVIFITGCNNNVRFSQPYKLKADPFIPIYQTHLKNIKTFPFDSKQVSNKHLDPEMIKALNYVNLILSNPDKYAPKISERIKLLSIEKITIASAARSANLQARISSSYKASYLSSFHLLGLAVDLEMKGKSFDIKSHPTNPTVAYNYATLKLLLNEAGLVFSEPVEKDPNHVELLKYCRKKNLNWDKDTLKEKEKLFLYEMLTLTEMKLFKQKATHDGIDWSGIYKDLLEKKALLIEKDH